MILWRLRHLSWEVSLQFFQWCVTKLPQFLVLHQIVCPRVSIYMLGKRPVVFLFYIGIIFWSDLLLFYLKCSPDLLKFLQTSILRQPSASNTEGPVEHRVFFIVSLTISESILSYITGCTSWNPSSSSISLGASWPTQYTVIFLPF